MEEKINSNDFLKPQPVVIHCDNVSDYVIANAQIDGWDLQTFKCSRPAFPSMTLLFEGGYKFKAPMQTNVSLVKSDEDFIGCMRRSQLKWSGDCEPAYKKFHADLLDRGLHDFLSVALVPERIRMWNGSTFVSAIYLIGLDELGQVLEDSTGNAFMFIGQTGVLQEYVEKGTIKKLEWDEIQRYMLITTLATLNFLNCRNVVVLENPPSRQQKRHAQQKGLPEPIAYKTLLVRPNKQRRAQVGVVGELSANHALHIVRGHFKDYRQGKGLGRFGGHGLWWWSPNVRGTDTERAIIKDYEVRAETESAA